MNQSDHFAILWQEGRTRFTKLLKEISEPSLTKKLLPATNSAGFLIRHMADVELLFAKNVFKATNVEVHAKTIIAQKDTGEWVVLKDLMEYQQYAADTLQIAILAQPQDTWHQTITTKEFGTITLAAALGRIVTHTAYHAGQLALILKYGK